MNYDPMFFCKYCRKTKPKEGREIVRSKIVMYRCCECSDKAHKS